MQMRNVQTAAFVCNAVYVRARVTHRWGRAAENTEVVAAQLWKLDDSGAREPVSAFLPLNLTWSHVGGPTIRVPRKLFRQCDVGHFQELAGRTMLILDTIVHPNPVQGGEVPNVLRPGRYEFELHLSSDNTKTLRRRWRIEFPTEWSDDESTMLDRITIRRV